MHDIEVGLEDRPGALADLGLTLGRPGVTLEGGGVVVVVEGTGIAPLPRR
jgi:hypothetical protein